MEEKVAQEIALMIKRGVTWTSIVEKYGLSHQDLFQLFKRMREMRRCEKMEGFKMSTVEEKKDLEELNARLDRVIKGLKEFEMAVQELIQKRKEK